MLENKFPSVMIFFHIFARIQNPELAFIIFSKSKQKISNLLYT